MVHIPTKLQDGSRRKAVDLYASVCARAHSPLLRMLPGGLSGIWGVLFGERKCLCWVWQRQRVLTTECLGVYPVVSTAEA